MLLCWRQCDGSWHMYCVRGETSTAHLCRRMQEGSASTVAETVPPKDSSSAEGTSLDRVLVDPLLVEDEVHPNVSPSADRRPPSLELQPGASPDTMPRKRPTIETQPMEVIVPQKDTSTTMKILVTRMRNPSALLKLHLKHHHISSAQFRHRTSSLSLPANVHDRYKEVVQACEHCVKDKTTLAKEQGVRLAGRQCW